MLSNKFVAKKFSKIINMDFNSTEQCKDLFLMASERLWPRANI
jgi:hypothetical protein